MRRLVSLQYTFHMMWQWFLKLCCWLQDWATSHGQNKCAGATSSSASQISATGRFSYKNSLSNIHHIRHLLTQDLAQKLACRLILCRIDYCNAVLYGAPCHHSETAASTEQRSESRTTGATTISHHLDATGAALAAGGATYHVLAGRTDLRDRQTYQCWSIWTATSRHTAACGHCTRRLFHYCKCKSHSDEYPSADVLFQYCSSIYLELSANICSELWLFINLKLDLKAICSLVFG